MFICNDQSFLDTECWYKYDFEFISYKNNTIKWLNETLKPKFIALKLTIYGHPVPYIKMDFHVGYISKSMSTKTSSNKIIHDTNYSKCVKDKNMNERVFYYLNNKNDGARIVWKNVRTLYQYTNPDKEECYKYIANTNISNKLSNIDMQKCKEVILVEECSKALSNMKLNKSPGIDGLTVELYKTF